MRASALSLTVLTIALAGCSSDMPTALTAFTYASASRAAAVEVTVPFRGSVEATETHNHTGPTSVVIEGVGTGTATELGRFTLDYHLAASLVTLAGEITMTMTAANGDQLFTAGPTQALAEFIDRAR
jgi:hypothetical protein